MTVFRFSKMQGLGNDFVVIDAVRQAVTLDADEIRLLADRRYGIGCDQVLLVEASPDPRADFRYRIFNGDGGEVQQCGNGARCFARFVHEQGLTEKIHIPVETQAGIITLHLLEEGQVTVDMGQPVFQPECIPFLAPTQASRYSLDFDGESLELGVLSMGNPHAIVLVDGLSRAALEQWGPRIERHPAFPERVNVGFMHVLNRRHVALSVWERGAGMTLACGTNACAAVVMGRVWDMLDEIVQVTLPGGDLVIQWNGEGQPVLMTGPAQTVFEGEWRPGLGSR